MRFFLFTLIVLSSLFGQAQLVNDSSVTVNGKKFCFHKLQKGETLFQLSRTYQVAYSVIKEANPDKGDAVNLGTLIKIPCEVIKQGTTGAQSPTVNSSAEKNSTNSSKLGEAIITDAEIEKVQIPSKPIDLTKQDVFRLGLMLPFNFEKNQVHMAANTRDEIPEFLLETRIFMDFYEGVNLALDTLAKLGKNIDVFVYDTKVDNEEIQSIMSRPEFSKLNMIIGPAYSSTFTYVADLCKNQNTYLVSPFVKNRAILENRPKVLKVMPSSEARSVEIAQYLYKYHLSDQIILCYETEKDKTLLTKVQAELQSIAKKNSTTLNKIPDLVFGINETINLLKTDVKNLVISMSTDENFTMKLVSRLHSHKDSHQLILFGMEEWMDFKNIEVNYWEDLKIHVAGNLDFTYGYGLNETFFKKYYQKYGNEPAEYAVLGYDVVFSLLKNLENNQFEPSQIVGKYFIGGRLDMQFKYGLGQNGIENKACGIYAYQNFKFIKVDD